MAKFYPALSQVSRWSSLCRGDIVDVVAPASACTPAELQGGLQWLKSCGLVPRVSSRIFGSDLRHSLFAQTDDERFLQLKQAFLAQDSKVIWCVRGGYGSLRLLERLAGVAKPKITKLLIGYSDITTLHNFVQAQWGWPSLHGPLLDRFGRGENRPRETQKLLKILFGDLEYLEIPGLRPLNKKAQQEQLIRSSVVGGNMTVLQSGLGTPWQVLPNRNIIFFEDRGERPHRLDRMLKQFYLSGYFHRARAILFGPLLVNSAVDRRMIVQDVWPRFAQEMNKLGLPVLYGMPCGHGDLQWPLPLLTQAQLSLTRTRASLRIDSGAL